MTTLAPERKAKPLDLTDPETLALVQRQYEAAMPRIREHAEIKFRYLRDPGSHDDAIANTLGIGWKHWLSAIRHGKDPNEFVSSIAEMSVRHVRAGRRVDGQERAKDVMSRRAQEKKGFAVEQLQASTRRSHEEIHGDPHGQEHMDAMEVRLTDNTRTSPPEQAAFREQYGMLLDKVGPRKRPIVEDMAGGSDTKDLADRHKVSQGRISQIRREAEQTWRKIDRLGDGDDQDRSR